MNLKSSLFAHSAKSLAQLMLLAGLITTGFPSTTWGDSSQRGIASTGSSSISIKPTLLRVQAPLQAQSSDARAAIESLREIRAAAEEKLTSLKANVDSIEFSDTKFGDDEDNEMGAYMQMMRSQGSVPDDFEEPVKASCTVTAEWNLPPADNDALILFMQRLQEKIKELDVMGEELAGEESEEQAEVMEAMAEMMGSYGGSSSNENTLVVRFVGIVTDDQRSAATKEAFQASKKKATSLANAAGLKCGELLSISQEPSIGDYEVRYYSAMMSKPIETADDEVDASNPGDLKYAVSVMTTFELLR